MSAQNVIERLLNHKGFYPLKIIWKIWTQLLKQIIHYGGNQELKTGKLLINNHYVTQMVNGQEVMLKKKGYF